MYRKRTISLNNNLWNNIILEKQKHNLQNLYVVN